jgi:hypothetical protein
MRRIALAALPLALAACSAAVKPNGDVAVHTIHARDEWKATLAGTGAAAGLTGDVHAVTDGAKTEITLKVENAAPGRTYPWHVHAGGCGGNGAVIGPTSAYPAATIGTDGKTTSTAHLNFPLSTAATYSVNVHASTRAMGTIVACAPLAH